jgi:cyclic-di-GMP-binding protein
MLTLPLEPTDDLANPLFKNAAGCAQWLKQLQLTNLQLAHSQLLTQINELTRFPMRGSERLNILELLRDTVHHVQNDYAKKLIAKPLPLNESELVIFVAIVQLWQAMTLGYQRCLQTWLAGDMQLSNQDALLCQRCLLYSGFTIFEHLRTGYEFDPKLWRQLHGLYAFAEEQKFQLKEVSDPLNSVPLNGYLQRSSCQITYVKTLLFCYARPAELTRSQLLLLDDWLTEWSNTISVEYSCIISKGDAQPFALDLAGTQGLQPVALVKHSESMRYMAMVPLSKLLRVKTILLQQGRTPQQVSLSGNNNARECIDLLTFLHQRWCEDNSSRFGARNPASQQARLCYKPENIYALLSGRAFKPSMQSAVAESMVQKQIESLGQELQNASNQPLGENESTLETWQLENESILGAKLTRIDTLGGRLSHNQLLALRVDDAETFTLGTATWLSVSRTGQLCIGMRYLPGTVQAITLRKSDENMDASEKFAPGFLLQAVPALKSPPSLIIPRNWFKPERVVNIQHQNGEKQQAKMGFSVERGIDYERVSFTLG